MKYILKTLDIIDKVSNELKLNIVENDKYRSLVADIYKLSKEDTVVLSDGLKEDIIVYLKSLDIQDEYPLLCKVSGIEMGITFDFEHLTDNQLLRYLAIVLRTVTYLQKDNLLLLKYSKTIWNTGWHNLAKQCRGKVIDLDTRQAVVYPFNKFFNLNEVAETKIEKVESLLDGADYISVTDKKDGSAIIVTNYNGEVIINTNGEFENEQIKLAKKLFVDKYNYFYNNVPEGYTFVFELIHPKNRIVLDYGDEQKLYLLAVRDLTSLKLLKYNSLVKIAKQFYLDITESFEFNDLQTFVDKTMNETENIKEGWVFRVIKGKTDMMFKLKYQEYFRLSRIKSIPSLKKVYALLQTGTLDDVLAVSENEIRDTVMSDVAVLFDYMEKFKGYIEEQADYYCKKYNQKIGEIEKEYLLKIVGELKTNPFSAYILRVVKDNQDINTLFDILPKTTTFEKLYKHYNAVYGIEEDNWDEKVSKN